MTIQDWPLRLRNTTSIDTTGLQALEKLAGIVHESGRGLILCCAREQPAELKRWLESEQHVGAEDLCANAEAALERAKVLLSTVLHEARKNGSGKPREKLLPSDGRCLLLMIASDPPNETSVFAWLELRRMRRFGIGIVSRKAIREATARHREWDASLTVWHGIAKNADCKHFAGVRNSWRNSYDPVAAQIRAALPRFRHAGDVQILESSFRFADAQELVARQIGFDGWQALKSGADAMTYEPRQTTPRPIFSSIEAQLFVANIKSSCDFYTNKLGFAVEFIYGDPPYYGQVVRDNARLNLRLVFEPVFVADVRKREHLLSASITVDTTNEIKQLFRSYQAAGVSFHQALKKAPWGARTFILSDPDGNLILFAGPAAD